jgi:PAS domain S-box-containing protein
VDSQPGPLLGAIFSASPDAIVVIDDLGRIVLTSPASTTLFGYYPEELVGEPMEILKNRSYSSTRSRRVTSSGKRRVPCQVIVKVPVTVPAPQLTDI